MSSISSSSTVSNWRDLPGLDRAKTVLSRLFSGSFDHHAVLLFGPRGSGAETLASVLAQYWLCLEPGVDGPCGECKPCRSFLNERAVDFLLVASIPPSQTIKVKAIYWDGKKPLDDEDKTPLNDFFRSRPMVARNKVAWIRDIEQITPETSNLLLKRLEEPYPGAKIVMTTSSPAQILPTVLSRCLLIQCELPQTLAFTSEMEQVFSENSPGMLEEIRGNAEAYESMYALLETITTSPRGAAIAIAERFRAIADKLVLGEKVAARDKQREAFRTLACYLLAKFPDRPEIMTTVLASHQRVTGNINFGYETDALFAELLLGI